MEIQPQDIITASSKIARDLLQDPDVAALPVGQRIVIDGEFFRNESASVVNKNALTDRLRVELNRELRDRLVFVARHSVEMLEQERVLQEEGMVTPGSERQPVQPMGWDYRLSGRITSLQDIDARTQVQYRWHQITFELVSRQGEIIWSNFYDFGKTGQEDISRR